MKYTYQELETSVTYISAEQPKSWEDERDVANSKDDSRQVDVVAADAEVSRGDISDDRELDPVHGIAAGTQHKQCYHQPAPSVLPELSCDSWHHCLHRCECCPLRSRTKPSVGTKSQQDLTFLFS